MTGLTHDSQLTTLLDRANSCPATVDVKRPARGYYRPRVATPPSITGVSPVTRGFVRSPIERESCEPLTVPETPPPTQPSIAILPMSMLPCIVPRNKPETPQYEVAMLPVTVEPTCSKVAVATEPPQLDRSSDMKLPLQVPATLAEGEALGGAVTEFEPWQPRGARAIDSRTARTRVRFRSFKRMEGSFFEASIRLFLLESSAGGGRRALIMNL